MAVQFGDARVEELQLLSEIDRRGKVYFEPGLFGAKRDMIAFVVDQGMVTDPAMQWQHDNSMTFKTLPGETLLERTQHGTRMDLLSRVLASEPIQLGITHRGRVRLSELKQMLRSGREREPFGILWDTRHWERDLQIAVLDARADAPVAIAYLDMNGLKQVNDRFGHDSGDQALRAYFQAVASSLPDHGAAYRLGGDEVLVLLPEHDLGAAVAVIRRACKKLMGENLELNGENIKLSIAAGIVTSEEPTVSSAELRSRADKVQYQAKERSREGSPRQSVIAVDGQDLEVIEHDTENW